MELPFEQLILGVGAFILVLAVSTSWVGALPIGALLAIYALAADVPVPQAAAIGALAVAATRFGYARAAHRRAQSAQRSSAGSAYRSAIRQTLAASRRFRRASFAVGFVPLVPARVVYPLFGSMGAPMSWLAAGTIVGQFLTLSLTTWLCITIGRAFTDSDRDAATMLGVTCVMLIILTWMRRDRNANPEVRLPGGQTTTSRDALAQWLGLATTESREVMEGELVEDPAGADPAGELLEGDVIEPQDGAGEGADEEPDSPSSGPRGS